MVLPALTSSPATPWPAPAPSSSMSGAPAYPGWVVASIVTGSVISGRAEAGEMVWTPVAGMAKTMTSAPTFALASRIAWRRDPAPLSAVLVTVRVAPASATAGASVRASDEDDGANIAQGRPGGPVGKHGRDAGF